MMRGTATGKWSLEAAGSTRCIGSPPELVVVGAGDRAAAITLAPSRLPVASVCGDHQEHSAGGLERAERDIGRRDAYIRSIEFERSVMAMRTKVLTGSF